MDNNQRKMYYSVMFYNPINGLHYDKEGYELELHKSGLYYNKNGKFLLESDIELAKKLRNSRKFGEIERKQIDEILKIPFRIPGSRLIYKIKIKFESHHPWKILKDSNENDLIFGSEATAQEVVRFLKNHKGNYYRYLSYIIVDENDNEIPLKS